ncbi:acetate--CoA ligase family protein [archaeon]|nr:acetate--CoA ligase family protein [archaeon]
MSELTKQIIQKALSEGRKALLEPEAKQICQEYGIPVPPFAVAKTEEEAVKAAEQFGYPVVLKIVSPQVLHKTDVGGVLVKLKNAEEVRKGYHHIIENVRRHVPDADIHGILVTKFAEEGVEVIVGAIKDPQFGPAVMFGLGGIFVELYNDVSFRLAPVSERDAREMIQEIKAYPILTGYRGRQPCDIETIVKIIRAVSQLVTDHPEISSLDLNPIEVYPKGAYVVDARIVL